METFMPGEPIHTMILQVCKVNLGTLDRTRPAFPFFVRRDEAHCVWAIRILPTYYLILHDDTIVHTKDASYFVAVEYGEPPPRHDPQDLVWHTLDPACRARGARQWFAVQ